LTGIIPTPEKKNRRIVLVILSNFQNFHATLLLKILVFQSSFSIALTGQGIYFLKVDSLG
jgi:hypothetical protein